MSGDYLSTLAQKLRPYWLKDMSPGTYALISGGGGGMVVHALNGSYHTGTLDQSQAPWAALGGRVIGAGAGLTGGGDLTADRSLSVGAGTLITVGADDVGITPGANHQFIGTGSGTAAAWQNIAGLAGNGLAHAAGVLAVGVGNTGAVGLSVEADLVRLTSSSNPGAAAAVLASDATGMLELVKLRTGLIDTASGNTTLRPAGDLVLDPVGNDVLPETNYDVNLGAINKKWLTIHAAEAWFETLVAQETIATIGGRILVGPTTTLTRDLAAATTTIYVKHNQMTSGNRGYMEANGKVEFFAITSGPALQGAGDYAYSVTRNLDGTGANDWYAGDAMFNMGTTGNGWIDLYSIRGVKSASQYGPTIVGNVRLSATYNDWAERWAAGNLNGLYGYGVDTYGFAAGNPAAAWAAMDATNGVRIMAGNQTRLQLGITGNLRLYNPSGTPVISLDNDGSSYFAGIMTIGTGGEIRQGTGTLGSNYTGLRIWRDGNVGRIAGYNANTLQWYAGTDGYLYAGGGAAAITRYGYMIQDTPDNPSLTWPFLWGGLHAVNDITAPGTGWKSSLMFGEPALVYSGSQRFRGWMFQFAGDLNNPPVSGEGSTADYALTIQDAAGHLWPVWHAGNDGASSGLDAGALAGMGLSYAGNRWGVIPYINEDDGVMAVGRFIDFHATDGDMGDNALRLDYGSYGYGLGITNGFGSLMIGANNGAWCHFLTDRPQFYFDKAIAVNGNIGSYSQDLVLTRAGTTRITGYTWGTYVSAHLSLDDVLGICNVQASKPANPTTGCKIYLRDAGAGVHLYVLYPSGTETRLD